MADRAGEGSVVADEDAFVRHIHFVARMCAKETDYGTLKGRSLRPHFVIIRALQLAGYEATHGSPEFNKIYQWMYGCAY